MLIKTLTKIMQIGIFKYEYTSQYDMLFISPINIHPLNVYIWSSILVIGAIIFIIREIKLTNQRT